MADYIKREDAIKRAESAIREYFEMSKLYGVEPSADAMALSVSVATNAIPAADVRENVPAEWVKKESPSMFWCECSICHYRPRNNDLSYFCPYCGADMRSLEVKE